MGEALLDGQMDALAPHLEPDFVGVTGRNLDPKGEDEH